MDDLDDQQISSEDIEMLNSNDFLGTTNKQLDSPLDSSDSAKSDSLDASYLIDTESKTPGEILDEFCMKLEDVNTTMPDSVINHYMKKAGFIVNDPKLVKIISIASQKFISEIVNDVMQHHKLKTKSATTTAASAPPAAQATTATNSKASAADKAKAAAASANMAANADKSTGIPPLTLTLEDLSQVLTEYGINVKKPYYFM